MMRCLLLLLLFSEAEASSDWREESFSGEREQPITVCPRLANSNARAFPSPRLTPVINTVLRSAMAAPPAVFMAYGGVGGATMDMPSSLLRTLLPILDSTRVGGGG